MSDVIKKLDNLRRFLLNFDEKFFSEAVNKKAYAADLDEAINLMKEQKSIIPWLSELMLNTNDEPIKPSEVIRRIEEGGLKRFAEEESQ